MKIPELESLRVAPEEAHIATQGVVQPEGFSDLARAGEQVGQAVNQVNEAYEKQQHEARVQEALEKNNDFTSAATDSMHGQAAGSAPGTTPEQAFNGENPDTGFLGLRGKAASEAEAATIEKLAKRRQDIAESIQDPQARQMFLNQSSGTLLGAKRTMAAHVGAQDEQVKVDTLEVTKDEAARAVALEPGNDELARQQIATVNGAAHGLGKGQEFTDLHTNLAAQRITETRLTALLADDNPATAAASRLKAREVLEANKHALGTQLAHYENILNKRDDAADATSIATKLVKEAIRPDGSLDETKLSDGLIAVGEQAPQKLKAVHEASEQLAAQRRKAYAADSEMLMAQAQAAFNTKGWAGMPPELKQALNDREYDKEPPALYAKLEREFNRRNKLAGESKVDQRRNQEAMIQQAKDWFNSLPSDAERAKVDLSPTGEFARKFPALTYHVEGVADGLGQLGPMQQRASERLQKGQSEPLTTFVDAVVKNLEGGENPYLQKGRTPSEKAVYAIRLEKVRSRATQAWEQESHGGKVPSEDWAQRKISGIWIETHGPNRSKSEQEEFQRRYQEMMQPPAPTSQRSIPFKDRVDQLRTQKGMTADKARSILQSEGYDLTTGARRGEPARSTSSTGAPPLDTSVPVREPVTGEPVPDEDTPPIPGSPED